MTVLEEIAAERQRQILEKGYDAAHDDDHDNGEIALAAASFTLRSVKDGSDFPIFSGIGFAPLEARRNCGYIGIGGLLWPWKSDFPYHNDKRTRLIKAAALLVAEIERLDRTAKTFTECKEP